MIPFYIPRSETKLVAIYSKYINRFTLTVITDAFNGCATYYPKLSTQQYIS